jgi:hypothetical protein
MGYPYHRHYLQYEYLFEKLAEVEAYQLVDKLYADMLEVSLSLFLLPPPSSSFLLPPSSSKHPFEKLAEVGPASWLITCTPIC